MEIGNNSIKKIKYVNEFIVYCCTLCTLRTVIMVLSALGGAAVRRRTRDRKVSGSTPGQDAIKSTRSTQPSIPPG